jgi:hypothetical protein
LDLDRPDAVIINCDGYNFDFTNCYGRNLGLLYWLESKEPMMNVELPNKESNLPLYLQVADSPRRGFANDYTN